jgi:hypothetical protein
MEGKRSRRSTGRPDAKARRQAVVEYWQREQCPRVGARELLRIQNELARRFGETAVESPAAIARLLADEGAELRHPEIIECDAEWRLAFMEQPSRDAAELPSANEPLTLPQVVRLIEKLDELGLNGDKTDAQALRSVAIQARKTAQLEARRKSLDESQRNEQIEIAEWLGVWIKTPNLFKDWMELRKRSAEFRGMFPEKDFTPDE